MSSSHPVAPALRRVARGALVAWLALVSLLLATPAEAHQVGLSRGTYQLTGAELSAAVVFQNGELAAALPGSDRDRDGSLDASELGAARPALEERIVRSIQVHGDGQSCAGSLRTIHLVEGDGIALDAVFRCPTEPAEVTVDLGFFPLLSHGHRQLSSLSAGKASTDAVTFASNARLTLQRGAPGAPPPPAAPRMTLGGLFLLGVEHILTGYDHLVFLLGLVLVGGRLRSLVAVVTAFTLAHSITLALAAFGIWSPSGRIIEPAIALSIAYVGIENFFVKSAEGRWRITFPFGLIHGFGFAGALAEVALPRSQVPAALLLFNLGVEAGQLAVMLPLLGLLHVLRKQAWFARYGVRAVSAMVIVAGVGWFIERVFSPGS